MEYRGILVLVSLVLLLVAGDFLLSGGQGVLFLAGKLVELIEYLAIWR